MWFRAVAAALAVWAVSGAAMAAGYTEVWNPPEASGHAAPKSAKKKPTAVKAKAGASLKGAGHAPRKAARGASATTHIGEKTAARGNVKTVAAKGTKGGVKPAAVSAGKARPKTAVVAQSKKPHAQLVHAKAGQGKVVRADLMHPVRPHAVSVAAKSAAAKPVVSHSALPVASANFNSGSADASTNPATASSGSLPPIIH
ncbi:hypothetical protein ABH945_004407 [Paraburkholderia sp. GAS333]|uniref:hypothetical protein n=1 Tax=Paraburkholderia sp. GAS333 TaxID=3156279 RepID=UPI003D1B6C90